MRLMSLCRNECSTIEMFFATLWQLYIWNHFSVLKNCAMYLKVARIRAINKCQINNVPRGVDPAPERSPKMLCRQLETHRIFQESPQSQGKSPQSPSHGQKSPCDTKKHTTTKPKFSQLILRSTPLDKLVGTKKYRLLVNKQLHVGYQTHHEFPQLVDQLQHNLLM